MATKKTTTKTATKKTAATKKAANDGAVGKVTQILGAVVDVQFDGAMPAILNALETEKEVLEKIE